MKPAYKGQMGKSAPSMVRLGEPSPITCILGENSKIMANLSTEKSKLEALTILIGGDHPKTVLMKFLLVTAFFSFVSCVQAQFELTASEILLSSDKEYTDITLLSDADTFDFHLDKSAATVQRNFVIADKQVIQFVALKIDTAALPIKSVDDQELLRFYSKYELDYLTNELRCVISDASNQWVSVNDRYWFIWYFKIDSIQDQQPDITIQLFASTVVNNKVLTINTPMYSDDNFLEVANMLNDIMESLHVR